MDLQAHAICSARQMRNQSLLHVAQACYDPQDWLQSHWLIFLCAVDVGYLVAFLDQLRRRQMTFPTRASASRQATMPGRVWRMPNVQPSTLVATCLKGASGNIQSRPAPCTRLWKRAYLVSIADGAPCLIMASRAHTLCCFSHCCQCQVFTNSTGC